MQVMIHTIGLAGGIFLAICGIPLVYEVWQRGNADHVNAPFLWLWLAGTACTWVYVLGAHGLDWPLLINYTVNTIGLLFIIFIKYKGKI
jgi:uncharacterized protein with PQ loop repeat